MDNIKFPKDFLWGAAASSHQVEGNNTNNDWWEWENTSPAREKSGRACNHYELYEQDFDLARSLNHNCHRLSIEWSRVEPEKGKFSADAIDHYKKVILALQDRGLEPVVTLHHFTNPLWFSRIGGWENRRSIFYFSRYTEKIVSALADKVRFWVTINEPVVYMYHSYLIGVWPPQKKSLPKAIVVMRNMEMAHIKSYRIIHNIYKKNRLSTPFVSIAHNMRHFVPRNESVKNFAAILMRDWIYNRAFINRIFRAKAIDYIGLNYYSRDIIDARSWSFGSLIFDVFKESSDKVKKNFLGWDIHPEGFLKCLLDLKKYGLPVFILENGICSSNDDDRWDFIREHLVSLDNAMKKGINVIGYLYWSLLDNFEWADGFGPRFGLIEVDYGNLKRTVRESAKKYASVCKTGVLE